MENTPLSKIDKLLHKLVQGDKPLKYAEVELEPSRIYAKNYVVEACKELTI